VSTKTIPTQRIASAAKIVSKAGHAPEAIRTTTHSRAGRAPGMIRKGRAATTTTTNGPKGTTVSTSSEAIGTRGAAIGTAAKEAGQGAKNLAKHGGAIFTVLAIAFVIMLLARARGATVNLEKLVVSTFIVALVLIGIGSTFGLIFAALILITVLLDYGTLALGGIGSAGTSTTKPAQISSTGDLVAGAAAAAGVYTVAKAGSSAISGLATGAGVAAGSGILSAAKSIFRKIFSGAEDIAPEVAAA
jgi:hypothetical protein